MHCNPHRAEAHAQLTERPSSEARIKSYIKGFFPVGDLVTVAVLNASDDAVPLPLISYHT